jgi:hypothetical protein
MLFFTRVSYQPFRYLEIRLDARVAHFHCVYFSLCLITPFAAYYHVLIEKVLLSCFYRLFFFLFSTPKQTIRQHCHLTDLLNEVVQQDSVLIL